jgi:hypothetical protein
VIEAWRVTLALHRDSGLVEVRNVGEEAPAAKVTWPEAMEEAVRLAGPGATVRVTVLVPAVSGTFRKVNEYRLQLPGGRAVKEAKRGEDRAAAVSRMRAARP